MAAGATYEPLATTTLSSAQSDITFTSISGSYTDLRIVLVAKNSTANSTLRCQLNADTATNYSYTRLNGDGTTATSDRASSIAQIVHYTNLYSAEWAMFTYDFLNYAGSTNKTVLLVGSGDQNGSGRVERTVGLWRSTSAITSIKLFPSSNQFAIGTTATLYGIKAA